MYVSVSSVSIITATCSIDNIVYIISNLILYVEGYWYMASRSGIFKVFGI